jgi:hypothetical protein
MSRAVGRKAVRALLSRDQSWRAAAPDRDALATGMRAFFSIMDKWDLGYEQASTLLGQPGRSTFYGWKRGDIGNVVHGLDLATRISYVLGIYQALEEIYEQPEQADSWVHKPNDAFGGQSALERMLGGQIIDLARVREYLDSQRS